MTLVQKGVVPLEVDKSIVAVRQTFFKDNWSKISQDQWVLNTIRGYKIEFVTNPSQGRRPRVAILPNSQQRLVREEDVIKRGNHRSPPRESRLLLQPVSGPQKQRGHEASHQSEEPQHLPIISRWRASTH